MRDDVDDEVALCALTGIPDFDLSRLVVTGGGNGITGCCSNGEGNTVFGGRRALVGGFGSFPECCLLIDDLLEVRPLQLAQGG